jgi:putative ABC transport system substrate-binding protein
VIFFHIPAWSSLRGITLLGGAAAAWPLAAHAQQSERVRRIGVLLPFAATDPQPQAWVGALLQSLALSGWIIDRNIHLETRYATGNVLTFAGTRPN